MADKKMKIKFEKVIDDTLNLLSNNPEWIKRYEVYGKAISKNLESIKVIRKTFHEWSPLNLYITTNNALTASAIIKFELRYLGQTVANIISRNELIKIDTKKYDGTNKDDFDCDINLDKADWRSIEAKSFRAYFKKLNIVSNRSNEEHRIESLLLSEFSKSKNKVLSFIKPVMIANIRYPMPTPLSASNHSQIKYSGAYGGGIDILARTGQVGNTNLCIMEVKDEYKKTELPELVIRQGLIYATFIRELLKSESGELWWKLFGFRKKMPQKLILNVACVMPLTKDPDKSFEGMELTIGEDIVKLHYAYFLENNNEIISIDTSLNRNFKNNMI